MPWSSPVRRVVTMIMLTLLGVLAGASSAHAHTDVDFTLPTDGATLAEPLTEITVAFTQPVTLVGPGFEVLSPQGEVTQPFVVTDDDMVFRLQIDPPMGGGDVGVRYEVTAPDGHVISGSFSFTVSADAPAPATTTPATEPPSTDPTPTSTDAVAEPSTTATAPTDDTPPPTVVTNPPEEATAAPDEAVSEIAASPDVVQSAGDDGDGNTGLFIAIAAAVAIGAGAFLLFRRQSAT